ncbi:MAG: HD-GYP domain-containing protein [Planctomycetota bacterium]
MLDTTVEGSNSAGDSGVNEQCLKNSQIRALEEYGDRINKFGANFSVCDAQGRLVLLCEGDAFKSNRRRLAAHGRTALEQADSSSQRRSRHRVLRLGKQQQVLAAALGSVTRVFGAALIDLGEGSKVETAKRRESSGAQNTDCRCKSKYLEEMLAIFADSFATKHQAEEQIEMVSSELAQTYEELVLLHKLSTNMTVTESDANYLQMACDSLTDIVSVEGIAILLEKDVDGEKRLVLAAGSGLIDIDEQLAAVLHNRLAEEIDSGKEALLDSEVDSPFRFDWPETVRNLIAVPLLGKDGSDSALTEPRANESHIIGLMVAVNRIGKSDFDSTDSKLFNSVANGCAVFVENGRLFRDLKELFVGSLKALTNSIDAKDQYTRGHSERVAFISRWIAEKVAEQQPMCEEDIHKVYLAGLLHDIGKMGIGEAVLRKKGKLTEQEIEHIRSHPSIGAGILGDIKQMRDIVPGVLCHHEQMDGKGYPHGLCGEQIPLIGRIVKLADGFDAMTSKRVYRDALTVEQALAEIEKGLGTQFDEQIGRLFLQSDVYQLWDVIQDGSSLMGTYAESGFAEYGTVAVGTLIR